MVVSSTVQEEVTMFAHHCTACEKLQVVSLTQATSLAETPDGLAVSFTCWCGAPQTWVASSGAKRGLGLAA